MHPDIESLLALQERDQIVAAADEAMAALDPETQQLDETLQSAERALEQARRGVQEANGRRETLEGKIASYRTMQEQRRQRLEWVRGAKEASTLMAELDLTRSVLAKEEAEFMRSGDAVTAAELKVVEAEQALEELRAEQAARREEIAGRRDAIMADRERALERREEQARQVRQGLLVRYERIRKGKAPLALYALHGEACGHCFTAIPTQRRSVIAHGSAIEGCEACGVLLYASE